MKTEIAPAMGNNPFVVIYTFAEYQREALKTASMGKGRVVEGLVRVCGLVGESAELCAELMVPLAELDQDRIAKELGDVLWYAATLSEWFGHGTQFEFDWMQKSAVNRRFLGFSADVLLQTAGKLAEIMKKHLGHDKPMDAFEGREKELMNDVFLSIANVANVYGLNLGRVAAVNINKLRARHNGSGFTAAAQNAKADEMTTSAATQDAIASETVEPTWYGDPVALPLVCEGSRNTFLFDCAAKLRKQGSGPDAILKALVEANQRFTQPLSEDDVKALAVT